MSVSAKFRVTRHTPLGSYEKPDGEVVAPTAVEVEMTPDYAGGRNAAWSKATPSGVIRLTISNMDAVDHLPLNSPIDVLFSVSEE